MVILESKMGKIVDVVMTDPGSGFLPNTTETTRYDGSC